MNARFCIVLAALSLVLAAPAAAQTVTLDLIPPGTLYGQRAYQFDARLTKIISLGNKKIQGNFDLYNLLNANPVLLLNRGLRIFLVALSTPVIAASGW